MSTLRRWAADPRLVVDVVVVVIVAALAVFDVSTSSAERRVGETTADALAYALVLAGALALAWRRRAPIVVLAVVTACVAAFWLRGYGAMLSVLGLPALYAVPAHAERQRRAWWALGVSSAVLLGTASVSVLDKPDGFAVLQSVSMAAFLAAAMVAGVVIRNRQRIFVDTERRAAQAEADRLAEAERAVQRERSRIAREMHDVVAHGMSVVAVQAAAGREIVHTDPDKAAEVFARIEAVGRESLVELRRMLGVLRSDESDVASLTPQPGMADVAALVAQAGPRSELIVEGRERPIARGVELAAFRIVQEALTNVRKHAGDAASSTVRIAFLADALEVEVADDGRGAVSRLAASGTRNGLIGMRERVEVYGGELVSGARAGGGWVVRARLPLTGEREDVR